MFRTHIILFVAVSFSASVLKIIFIQFLKVIFCLVVRKC